MKHWIHLLFFSLVLCGGLAAQPDTTQKPGWIVRREARAEAQWQKEQKKMYAHALEKSQEITSRKMVNDLWAVNDPQITRSPDSMILVLIPLSAQEVNQWTGSAQKVSPASLNPREMWWVSLDPQLSSMLQNEPIMDSASVMVCIKQFLGLPPEEDYSYVATFWISPEYLFRPTPNPDPTLHHSTVRFPETVDPAHKTWMETCRKEAYQKQPAFAWTQLGYAYDWGNPANPVGVSQFVVKSNAPIQVESLSSWWYWYSQQVSFLPLPLELFESTQ